MPCYESILQSFSDNAAWSVSRRRFYGVMGTVLSLGIFSLTRQLVTEIR